MTDKCHAVDKSNKWGIVVQPGPHLMGRQCVAAAADTRRQRDVARIRALGLWWRQLREQTSGWHRLGVSCAAWPECTDVWIAAKKKKNKAETKQTKQDRATRQSAACPPPPTDRADLAAATAKDNKHTVVVKVTMLACTATSARLASR